MDNRGTQVISSLYETFPPEEAFRLSKRIEIHYTPKHGSWLDSAEIERSALAAQRLGNRRIPSIEALNEEPRSKLLGIFVGEEIYTTGEVHTPIRKSAYNIFRSDKFFGVSSGVWTPPSNQKGVVWHFTTGDARSKLKRLYPIIL
jgi:hypothetical protein